MKQESLAGRNKFGTDVFWCLLISAVITLYQGFKGPLSTAHSIGYMISIFTVVFVIFFLWSWKKEDARSYKARCLLTVTCGFWFLFIFTGISGVLHDFMIFGFHLRMIWALLAFGIPTALIVKKYCSLMYKEIK